MASVADIRKEVKIILYRNREEYTLEDVEGLADLDSLRVDELIEELIGVAVDKIYAMCPAWMLGDVVATASSVTWDHTSDDYASVCVAPDDALRIVLVKLPTWKKPCVEITTFDSPVYSSYRSEFAGIRPTKSFPAVAVGQNYVGTGAIRIEAYPKDSTSGAVIKYVKKFDDQLEVEGDDINISKWCYRSILYTIASLFYTSLGDANRATMMENEAIKLFETQVKFIEDGRNA